MTADLEILARELKEIAEEGAPRYCTDDLSTWAEGWLLSLVELGIRPAPYPEEANQ